MRGMRRTADLPAQGGERMTGGANNKPSPGARGLESARALLRQLPLNWKQMSGATIRELLQKTTTEMGEWESGNEPSASLQLASGYLLLALTLALDGQSPPIALAAPTPEETENDKRGRRPRPKQRYSREEATA